MKFFIIYYLAISIHYTLCQAQVGNPACPSSATVAADLKKLDNVIAGADCKTITSLKICTCTVPPIIANITTTINALTNDCSCTNIAAILTCILNYENSLTAKCNQYACIQYILQLLNQQLRAKLTTSTYAACQPTVVPILGQLDASLTACQNETIQPLPPLCTNTPATVITNIPQCGNISTLSSGGTLGSTVINLLTQLNGILNSGLVSGIFRLLCEVINKLLGNKQIQAIFSGLVAQLTNVFQVPTPGLSSTCSCLNSDCNSLVALLTCLLAYITQYANSSGGSPCVCGVLLALIQSLLNLVNTILGNLAGYAGGNYGGANCQANLNKIAIQLNQVTCCISFLG